MSYAKITFNASTPLNITNLNILGSQYAEMKSTIVAHSHTIYYTKTESDARYVNINNDGSGSGCNALTIDGYTKDQLISSVPTGLMVWYAGSLAALDVGWHLADGTNGTRNCVNKYIIGANSSTIGNTGGNDNFTPTGTLTIANHALTLAEMPEHYHTWSETNYPASATYYNQSGWGGGLYSYGGNLMNLTTTTKNTSYIGSNQAHGHTGSTITLKAVENRPLSKALYLIQKI